MRNSGHRVERQLWRLVDGPRQTPRLDAQNSAADEAAEGLGEHRNVNREAMAFEGPEGEGEGGQHVVALQPFEHRLTPVIEQRKRTGISHQRPEASSVQPLPLGTTANALALALSGLTQRRSNSHTLDSAPKSVRR